MFNTIKNPEILNADDFEFREQDFNDSAYKSSGLKNFLNICSSIVLLASILLMPFLFGAVHELSYLSFRIAVFGLASAILLLDFNTASRALSWPKPQAKIFLALSALQIFLIAHAGLFYYFQTDHPVLGKTHQLLNIGVSLNILLEYACFLSLYFIALYRLEIDSITGKQSYINELILSSAFLVALTALSHWFYDNGKLFWVFSANFEGTSSRARWPFVNSNHLGIYLIIPIFLAIGGAQASLHMLKHSVSKLNRRGKIILSDVFSDISTQKILRTFIFQCLLVLTFGLTIIASLSRNAMSSSVFCLILLLLFPATRKQKVYARKSSDENEVITEESHSVSELGNRIRVRTKRKATQRSPNSPVGLDITKAIPSLKLIWRCCLFTGIIAIFWFFLGEKGGDLFKARLEYALLYTQDDMRWQLYKDSLPMLDSHSFLGIGLGNWASVYPSYMAEGLSGMLPGYLHSDLLQIAIETGLLGFFAFFCVFICGSVCLLAKNKVSHAIAAGKASKIIQLRAAYFGMLALIFSASFEFPFRIPAIVALFAITLALQANTSDSET